MEICAISDIHGDLIEIPECKVLCICGDIVPLNIQRNIDASIMWLSTKFRDWLLKVPCNYVVIIWGNHDFIGEELYNKGLSGSAQTKLLFNDDFGHKKVYILQDESVTIDGVNFFGTPWCPALRAWAFFGEPDKLNRQFRKIPTDTDILLTHCPPKYGNQGVVLQQNWNYLKDFGCYELQEVLTNKFECSKKPLYVLSGHIHSGNHGWDKCGKISYINVSIKDEDYNSYYYPRQFTI